MDKELREEIVELVKKIIKDENADHLRGIIPSGFEEFFDKKTTGFEYKLELKPLVFQKIKGKNLDEAKRLFYSVRQKFVEDRYGVKEKLLTI